MSPEEINPQIALYSTLLFFAGLFGLGREIYLRLKSKKTTPPPALEAWNLRPIDFALITCFTFLTMILVSGVAAQTYLWASGHETFPERTSFIINGFPMHITFILCMWAVYKFVGKTNLPPSNPNKLKSVFALPYGFYFYITLIPIVTVLTFGWQKVLVLIGLPAEQQDLVKMVAEMDSPLLISIMALLAIVVVPISEELVFRGFIFRSLLKHTSYTWAAIISSFFFAAIHVNWFSFLPLWLLGFWLCRSYKKTGNLLVPIFIHAIFNGNTLLVLLLTQGE